MKPHWHTRFLALAAHIATWSRDPEKKVGSVIVRPDKTIATMGFNGFPRGVDDLPDRYIDRNLKLDMVVHAEMNAILHAREPLHGYTLYVWPFHPCTRCATAIIQAGISHVVTVPWVKTTKWAANIDLASTMLKEAGIAIQIVDEAIVLPELFIEPPGEPYDASVSATKVTA